MGRFSPSSGICEDCKAGQYQEGRGALSCVDCPPDTYSSEAAITNKDSCQPCNIKFAKFTTTAGISGVSDPNIGCVCSGANVDSKISPGGFYSIPVTLIPAELDKTDPLQRDICMKCPEGASCMLPGMLLNELTAKNGYWRATPTSKKFASCSQGHRGSEADIIAKQRCCPLNSNGVSTCLNMTRSLSNDTSDQCIQGFSGPTCLVCAENYVAMGSECVICEAGASFAWALVPMIGANVLLYFAVLLFVMCGSTHNSSNMTLQAKKLKRKKKIFGQIKILLSFVQIFAAMPSVLDSVPWPPIFVELSVPLGFFNFDIVGILSQASCAVSVRFFDKFVIHMMLPGLIFITLFLAFVTARICTSKENKERKRYITESVSKVTILMTLLIYPGLSTKVFQMWKCQSINGIDGRMLVQDFSIFCNQGEHVMYTIIAFIFLICYIIGIPLVIFVLLWRNKKHLHDEDSSKHHFVAAALGGLYTQYEDQYWWFELVNLLNKTLMCGGLVVLAPGSSYQILCAVLIMLSHLLAVLKLAPYKKDSEDMSCTICTMSIMLTSLGAYAMKLRSNSEHASIIGNVLVVITLVTVVSCITITLVLDCGCTIGACRRCIVRSPGACRRCVICLCKCLCRKKEKKKKKDIKVTPVKNGAINNFVPGSLLKPWNTEHQEAVVAMEHLAQNVTELSNEVHEDISKLAKMQQIPVHDDDHHDDMVLASLLDDGEGEEEDQDGEKDGAAGEWNTQHKEAVVAMEHLAQNVTELSNEVHEDISKLAKIQQIPIHDDDHHDDMVLASLLDEGEGEDGEEVEEGDYGKEGEWNGNNTTKSAAAMDHSTVMNLNAIRLKYGEDSKEYAKASNGAPGRLHRKRSLRRLQTKDRLEKREKKQLLQTDNELYSEDEFGMQF